MDEYCEAGSKRPYVLIAEHVFEGVKVDLAYAMKQASNDAGRCLDALERIAAALEPAPAVRMEP